MDSNAHNDFPISDKWIERVLREAFESAHSEAPEIESITRIDQGNGYTSFIGKIRLSWKHKDDDNSLPESVILKVPTITKLRDNNVRWKEENPTVPSIDPAMISNLLRVCHNNEAAFYSAIRDLNFPPSLAIPRCYSCGQLSSPLTEHVGENPEGFLLLQDFQGIAKCPDFVRGLSLGQARALVRFVGAVQAFGIANESRWNTGQLTEINAMKVFFGDWDEWLQQGLKTIKLKYPGIATISPDELAAIGDSRTVFEAVEASSGSFYPVLTHGDLWCGNELFYVDDAGAVTDRLAAVVDWQNVRSGNLADDLSRILVLCCDHELRRKNELQLLREYYDSLKQHLAVSDQEVPFSFEEVVRQYSRIIRYAAASLLIFCGNGIGSMDTLHSYSASEVASFVQRMQEGLSDALASLKDPDGTCLQF